VSTAANRKTEASFGGFFVGPTGERAVIRGRQRHNARVVALRRFGLATLVLLGALALVSVPGAGAASTGAVAGNVDPALDAVDPGTIDVAASGAPVRGVVPLVVQNRKSGRVTRIRISARAVDGNGRTVARANTRSVVPGVLDPDTIGLARLDFGDASLPPSTSFEFDVTAKPARHAAVATLQPTAFRLSPPTTGPVAQTLEVTLRNPTARPIHGPVRVALLCFGESRRPVLYVAKQARLEQLAPGMSVNATVELGELCPAYLVGASTESTR